MASEMNNFQKACNVLDYSLHLMNVRSGNGFAHNLRGRKLAEYAVMKTNVSPEDVLLITVLNPLPNGRQRARIVKKSGEVTIFTDHSKCGGDYYD